MLPRPRENILLFEKQIYSFVKNWGLWFLKIFEEIVDAQKKDVRISSVSECGSGGNIQSRKYSLIMESRKCSMIISLAVGRVKVVFRDDWAVYSAMIELCSWLWDDQQNCKSAQFCL